MNSKTSTGKVGTVRFRLGSQICHDSLNISTISMSTTKRTCSRRSIFLSLKNMKLITMSGTCGIKLRPFRATMNFVNKPSGTRGCVPLGKPHPFRAAISSVTNYGTRGRVLPGNDAVSGLNNANHFTMPWYALPTPWSAALKGQCLFSVTHLACRTDDCRGVEAL